MREEEDAKTFCWDMPIIRNRSERESISDFYGKWSDDDFHTQYGYM